MPPLPKSFIPDNQQLPPSFIPDEPRYATGVQGFGVGLVQSALGTLRGAGELGTKVLDAPLRRFGITPPKGADIYRRETPLGQKALEAVAPKNASQRFGKLTGDIAQFVAPTSKLLAIEKGAGLLGRATIEGAVGGGLTAIQQGQVDKNVGINTGISAAIPVVGTAYKAFRGVGSVDTVIDKSIDKAVRPTVSGKSTLAQKTTYYKKAREAVKTIVHNKNALNIVDQDGKGKILPTSLNEFSQAIDSTKKIVFKQYDNLASQAGSKKASVSLQPIALELQKIADNKVLKTVAPSVAKYADNSSLLYHNARQFTAEETQEAIQTLNKSLDAFYRNPSYDTATRASIDAMVVNNLRESLDTAIENASGPGYQALKNTYGNLRAIEKEVIHRSIVDARKNVKGFIDFSDIFSGQQVIQGILTMDPVTISSGVSSKLIASLYKRLNNPNKIIQKMFENVDTVINQPSRTGFPARIFGSVKGSETQQLQETKRIFNKPRGGPAIFLTNQNKQQ